MFKTAAVHHVTPCYVSVAAAAGVITLILGLVSTAAWLKIAKWDTQVYR